MSLCLSPSTCATLPTMRPSEVITFHPCSICSHETGSVIARPARLGARSHIVRHRPLSRVLVRRLGQCSEMSPGGILPHDLSFPRKRTRRSRTNRGALTGADGDRLHRCRRRECIRHGWPMHPQDEDDDASAARLRTVYLGGAGVVDALHRLARRGFVELPRDYVPYLERSLEAQPDFPDQDAERSLWMGETGIRLVLQRLAPSRANLERLSELIAANERDERCELMSGSPGTNSRGPRARARRDGEHRVVVRHT